MTLARCDIPGCDKPLAVGVGKPVRWVCIDHFNDYLEDEAKVIALIVDAARRSMA
jgi:hypothetical protein